MTLNSAQKKFLNHQVGAVQNVLSCILNFPGCTAPLKALYLSAALYLKYDQLCQRLKVLEDFAATEGKSEQYNRFVVSFKALNQIYFNHKVVGSPEQVAVQANVKLMVECFFRDLHVDQVMVDVLSAAWRDDVQRVEMIRELVYLSGLQCNLAKACNAAVVLCMTMSFYKDNIKSVLDEPDAIPNLLALASQPHNMSAAVWASIALRKLMNYSLQVVKHIFDAKGVNRLITLGMRKNKGAIVAGFLTLAQLLKLLPSGLMLKPDRKRKIVILMCLTKSSVALHRSMARLVLGVMYRKGLVSQQLLDQNSVDINDLDSLNQFIGGQGVFMQKLLKEEVQSLIQQGSGSPSPTVIESTFKAVFDLASESNNWGKGNKAARFLGQLITTYPKIARNYFMAPNIYYLYDGPGALNIAFSSKGAGRSGFKRRKVMYSSTKLLDVLRHIMKGAPEFGKVIFELGIVPQLMTLIQMDDYLCSGNAAYTLGEMLAAYPASVASICHSGGIAALVKLLMHPVATYPTNCAAYALLQMMNANPEIAKDIQHAGAIKPLVSLVARSHHFNAVVHALRALSKMMELHCESAEDVFEAGAAEALIPLIKQDKQMVLVKDALSVLMGIVKEHLNSVQTFSQDGMLKRLIALAQQGKNVDCAINSVKVLGHMVSQELMDEDDEIECVEPICQLGGFKVLVDVFKKDEGSELSNSAAESLSQMMEIDERCARCVYEAGSVSSLITLVMIEEDSELQNMSTQVLVNLIKMRQRSDAYKAKDVEVIRELLEWLDVILKQPYVLSSAGKAADILREMFEANFIGDEVFGKFDLNSSGLINLLTAPKYPFFAGDAAWTLGQMMKSYPVSAETLSKTKARDGLVALLKQKEDLVASSNAAWSLGFMMWHYKPSAESVFKAGALVGLVYLVQQSQNLVATQNGVIGLRMMALGYPESVPSIKATEVCTLVNVWVKSKENPALADEGSRVLADIG